MNDKEVGELWRMKREDIRFMDIHNLILKLVEERKRYYDLLDRHGPIQDMYERRVNYKRCEDSALRDFGIKVSDLEQPGASA